ncbi:MAG: ribosome biogenesis GTPase YqeH [Bacilli bacterium]|jgi:ribosome biogenesis GTPase YqeH
MSEVKKVRRCYGCGEILQTSDPDAPGFITEFQLARHEIVLCQACFEKNAAGHDALNEPIFNADFTKILARIKATQALIVYVVDVFNFETSFMSEVTDAIRDNRIVVVANKLDLLPENVSQDKIRDYVAKRCEQAYLKPERIVLASSTKNYNIEEVIASIEELRDGRSVYFIGAVSSGKSSLINTLLKNFQNESRFYITTSFYPNTTLKVIEIPLDDRSAIYDTPGLSISNSIIGQMANEREVIRAIVPRSTVTPRVYHLKPGQGLIFGGIARFDFLAGPRTSFTVYVADDVKIHRVDLRQADATFDRLIRRNETQPISKKINSHIDLDVYEIRVDYDDACDVALTGLGWISFKGEKQVLRAYVPKGVSIYHNTSKI